jgi:hypothetical protein
VAAIVGLETPSLFVELAGFATPEVSLVGLVALPIFDTNSFASLFNLTGVVAKFVPSCTEVSLSDTAVSSGGITGGVVKAVESLEVVFSLTECG